MKNKKEDKRSKDDIQVITTHHEAGRDYFIEDTLEVGIVLTGAEVKSLRIGKASLSGSFARLDGGELFLYNLYIPPYDIGGERDPEPSRKRKLLVRRSQLDRLQGQTAQKGLVLIPLKLYFKHGLVKVDLALGKGKTHFDRRADIKDRSARREIDRAMKSRNRKDS